MKVGVHQGSALMPLLFAIVVDGITESVRNGLMGVRCCMQMTWF